MIKIQSLQKVIENRTVLDIASLVIQPGEVAAVVGPAESGTSVLLALLLGKLAPTTGSLQLSGSNPLNQAALSQSIGVLFSDDSLYLRQTVRQNLAFHANLHNLPKERVKETLTHVGLGDHADIKVEKLASGLRRRLAFGRAILHSPPILILVDPFARCDGTSIDLLSQWIQQEADQGDTVLILADDNAHLHTFCDTIYQLEDGRITASYDPKADQQEIMPFKIPVKLEGRVVLVNPSDILYADASEGKSTLQTRHSRLQTQFTLNELEERLGRSGFFRAHRSYLVNLQHVKEVIPYTRNSFSLRLDDDDNTEIPLSRSAAAELRNLLGY